MRPASLSLLSKLKTINLLAATLVLGCSAKASLNLSTPGAGGSGTVRGQASAGTGRPVVRIVRNGDHLRYENGEIEFETGSAELKGATTAQVLDQLAMALKRYPELIVRVEGHTDSRGSVPANQRLSVDRARAIQAALVERGVKGDRLAAVGLGETHAARPEPSACHNRSEAKISESDLPRCHEVWTANRRADFIVTEGGDSLPAEGSEVSEAPEVREAAVATPPAPQSRRPDWALRLFGGYALAVPGDAFHGGHVGLGVHASKRFGKRGRGYIGGGPRLHYRGLRRSDITSGNSFAITVHQFGPEGDLLVGGGSSRIVGLFSLRLGLGLAAQKGSQTDGITTTDIDQRALGGWLLGGVVVLGKLSPRWSLGGHAEFGIAGLPELAFAAELGLNLAWHFGRGRRDGL